jgi:hypothetical protein
MFSPVACTASFDFRFCVVPANAGTHMWTAPVAQEVLTV